VRVGRRSSAAAVSRPRANGPRSGSTGTRIPTARPRALAAPARRGGPSGIRTRSAPRGGPDNSAFRAFRCLRLAPGRARGGARARAGRRYVLPAVVRAVRVPRGLHLVGVRGRPAVPGGGSAGAGAGRLRLAVINADNPPVGRRRWLGPWRAVSGDAVPGGRGTTSFGTHGTAARARFAERDGGAHALKAYGQPGARVGAHRGPPGLVERLHRINLPYPVAGPVPAGSRRSTTWRTCGGRRGARRSGAPGGETDGWATVTAPPVNFVLRTESAAAAGGWWRRWRAGASRCQTICPAWPAWQVSCGTEAETDAFGGPADAQARPACGRRLDDRRRGQRGPCHP
jgi:hypothetical protein